MSIIFIDWISTSDHLNFNRAFFSAIKKSESKCYVFDSALISDGAEYIRLYASDNRIIRFLSVLKVVLQHRHEQIFLLTYDPVYIIFLQLFFNKIIVFEHNTVPERAWTKHYILQKYFYSRRINRAAQFPAQLEMLNKITNSYFYLGSPIGTSKNLFLEGTSSIDPNVFILPSYRANIPSLNAVSHLFVECTIVVKKKPKTSERNYVVRGLDLRPLERIEFEFKGKRVCAAIISIMSQIRGTFWFNECFSNRIPILIVNESSKKLFQQTFENFPFVYLPDIKSRVSLIQKIKQIEKKDYSDLIDRNNQSFRERLLEQISRLGS